ncbi:MAG: ATP-binding cassette domain-containing protein, partial [Mycoplasma sp.]
MKKQFWKNINEKHTVQKGDIYANLEIIKSYKTNKKPLIEIIDLKQSFKSFRKEKLIYEGLSLNIYENETIAFLGGNGAGKTITVESICGYRQYSGGQIKYNYEYEHN